MSKPDEKLQARGGDMDARVKPLVWHKSKTTNWNDDWHTVPTGYTVRCADENGWKWATPLGSFGYASSPNGAKEAAQRDHEARTRWALEPAPDLAELRDDWDELMEEARAEAAKAMRKFPQPNYVISKIAEEAGEVVKAAIHCAEGRETAENLRGEMKQTLAMLYRLWVEGDQVHGLPPVAAALAKIKEQTK